MTTKPIENKDFLAYVDLLIRDYNCLVLGGESSLNDDQATEIFPRLSPEQQEQLLGIGSDVNWLHRGCKPAPRGIPVEEVTKENLAEYYRLTMSFAMGDPTVDIWRLLHVARLCVPKLPVPALAMLRANYYEKLGLLSLSKLFMEAAIDHASAD